MQHDPQDANPTTHREPDDVEAHGLSGKKIPPAAQDVAAHIWAGKPPVVDDVQAHVLRHEPAEDAQEAHGQGHEPIDDAV
jgi:hypothetical protein